MRAHSHRGNGEDHTLRTQLSVFASFVVLGAILGVLAAAENSRSQHDSMLYLDYVAIGSGVGLILGFLNIFCCSSRGAEPVRASTPAVSPSLQQRLLTSQPPFDPSDLVVTVDADCPEGAKGASLV